MPIRRSLTHAALALLVAAPLLAQGAGDADKKTAGGALPTGWSARKDRATAPDASVALMGTGVHVTSGAAAIYWRDKDKVSGPFSASATFTQMKAPSHPEAYGLFVMGNKLDTPDQNYAYILVRGDGKVTVKHRAGADVHTIIDWTANPAVHQQDANGKATNTVSVVAGTDSTRMMVNGAQVAAIAIDHANPSGYVGLRVNHNLDVHVDDFTVTPGNAAAKKAAKPASKPKKAKKKG